MAELHAGQDDSFAVCPSKVENPGTYFHPLLATLITGAARLMLAITERLATDRGLDWSFCDTDSFALAKPELMEAAEFAARVQSVIDWFGRLNPYAFKGSILKSEDVNLPCPIVAGWKRSIASPSRPNAMPSIIWTRMAGR